MLELLKNVFYGFLIVLMGFALIAIIPFIIFLSGSTNVQKINRAEELAIQCARSYEEGHVERAQLECAKSFDIIDGYKQDNEALYLTIKDIYEKVQNESSNN